MRQMKEELDSGIVQKIQTVLAHFKCVALFRRSSFSVPSSAMHRTDKDVHLLEESLIGILGAQEEWIPLLSHFEVFLPKAQRAIFRNKVRTRCRENITNAANSAHKP